MRARGQLVELRAADLRFTPDEVAAFLNEVMGLELSAESVIALEAHTEGWIAGLQLAALSMQDLGDRAAFVCTLSGSHSKASGIVIPSSRESQAAGRPQPAQALARLVFPKPAGAEIRVSVR